jgi:hypothetical protein
MTTQTALTELDILACKCYLLYIVSSSFGTFHELVSEHVAV